MVGIVTGNGLGLLGGSLGQLGNAGGLGSSGTGAAGGQAIVNAANGNLILQREDEFLRGLGLDASLLRTYNSAGSFNDDNADNWRLGLSRRVSGLSGTVNTAGSTVVRTDADGSEAVYTYDVASGRYVSNAGSGATDTLTYDGAWTWRDGGSQAIEHYAGSAADSRLAAIVDRNGNTLTLTYTGDLVTRIETSSGERIDFVYDSAAGKTANLLELHTQTRLPDGSYQTVTDVRYTYDTANRLTSVAVDLTPADGSTADGNTYVTRYAYDNDGRIAGITQTDGSEVRFTYDAQGRVATVSDVRSTTDIRVTTFDYSTAGQTTVTDALGHSTTLTYDATGQLTGVTDAAGTVSYAYDVAGNVIEATDARGNKTVYAYDDRNNRIYQRDAAGNVVEWAYSETNQVLSETTYRMADPDGAGAQLPSVPQVTHYGYDAQGNLRFVVSAEGRVSELRYDTHGLETSRIVYAGALYTGSGFDLTALAAWTGQQNLSQTQRVDTAYDFRGNVQSVTSYVSVGADGAGVSGTQSQTMYIYDQAGRLLQTIDPRGVATADSADYVTSYAYDGLGRLLSTLRTDAAGNSVSLGSTAYNDAARQSTVTLANGLITTTTYDTAGHAISVVQTNGANTAQVARTDYVYDADDRLVAQRVTTGAGSLLSSYAVYDDAGRKVADIDATGALTEYVYNADGQVMRTIGYANRIAPALLAGDPAGLTLDALRPAAGADRVVRQVYDAAGRLVKTIDAEGAVVTYKYDGASQLVRTVAYANRLTAAQLAALAGNDDLDVADINTMPVADAADRIVRQFYSNDGLLLGTLDAEGFLTENIYDAAGQLVQTIGYAMATYADLRATGALTALRPQNDAHDIASFAFYNARGQATGSVDAEGYLTEIRYDVAGNVTQTIRYANKVTASVTTDASMDDLRPAASASDRTLTSVYDSNNRLIRQESQPDGLVTIMTYDAVGNVISVVNTAGAAQRQNLMRYDVLGRVIATLSPENAARITAGMTQGQIDAIWNTYATRNTYDEAGRLTASTDALGRATLFYYDDAGRLTTTVNAAGEVSQVVYNAFGDAAENWHYKGALNATQLATLSGGSDSDAALADVLTAITTVGIVKTRSDLTLRGQIAAAYDALGNASQYRYNGFGELVQTSRALGNGNTAVSTLAYDRRGLVTEQHADSTGIDATSRNQYDAFGRLTQTTTPNGIVTTAVYDKAGRTIRTEVGSLSNTFTYDAFGRTLTRTNGDGTVTSVYADDQGKVTITTPEGIATSSVTNAFGELVSVTDGLGNVTTYQYNKDGQVLSITDPAGTRTTAYDTAGQQLSSTDRNGTVTQFTYDAVGRTASRTVDPTGLNLTTQYQYDALGRSVLMQDANGVWTRTDYDDRGQVTMVEVDPDGLALKTAYTYDAAGNTLTVIEGAGTVAARTTQYTYDALNRRTSEVVDPNGLANGLAITTSYAYDDAGNLVSKTDAMGHVTQYGYDADGRLTVTIDPSGAVTRTIYDAQGRVAAINRYATLVDTAALAVVGADGVRSDASLLALLPAGAMYTTTSYAYDHDGRQILTVDAIGVVRQTTYDANGNVLTRTTFANAISLAAAGSADTIAAALMPDATRDQTTSYLYDAANRLVESRDGLNIGTRYGYDANGNVASKTVAFGTVAASTTTYVYDAAGRVMEQTVAAGSPAAATTRYAYDALGNQLAVIDARGVELAGTDSAWALAQRTSLGYTDADGTVKAVADLTDEERSALLALYTSQTAYDAAGRKTATMDALGHVTQYAYDARGNLTQLTDPRGNSAYFYYDTNDRRTLYVDPEGYVSRTDYDADGNVASITQYANKATGNWDVGTSPAVTADAARDRITHYTYDAVGRQTSTTDAQGFSELRSYDAFGNLTTLTNQVGGVTTYTYDKRGLLLTETLPITSANATGVQIPVVNQYTYDARGNRLTETEAVGLPEQRTTTYAYDQADRLISKTGQAVSVLNGSFNTVTAASTETYSYDARGNRTVVDNNGRRTVTYYDANNRKTAEVDAVGTLTVWTLDAAGNSIVKRVYGTALALPVNANTLPVSTAHARETRYTFNANNQLLTTSQTAERTYSYAGGLVDGAVLTTTNAYDANGNVVRTVDANGNATHYFYDKVGNKTLQVDALGYGVAWQYDAAGAITRETRYASGLDGTTFSTVDIDSDATSLQAQFAAGTQAAEDRVTELVYDRMGRVTVQRVLNVAYSSVNSGTGAKSDQVGMSITTFTYNGLGKVTQQVDANGNATDIGYDALGREILRQLPQFTDAASAAVRQTVATAYDGVNQVESVTQWGKAAAQNRVTTFTYNAAGGMTGQTDAMGNTTTFGVNIFGETVQTSAARKNPDGTTTADVKRYTYDAMGRQIEEKDQTTGTTTTTRYDAFGAITGKGTNGLWSEVTEYNDQGLVWRTSNGDGVTKAFLYDGNGNATLKIESAGADLNAMTLTQMLASSDVKPTITVFDERNQVTDVIQPKMEFVHEDAGVQSILVPVTQDPFNTGNVSLTKGGNVGVTISSTGTSTRFKPGTESELITEHILTQFNIAFSLPDTLAALGAGNIQVDLTAAFGATSRTVRYGTPGVGAQTLNFTSSVANGVNSVSFPTSVYYGQGTTAVKPRPFTATVTLSKLVNGIKRIISTVTFSVKPIFRYISGYSGSPGSDNSKPKYTAGSPSTSATAVSKEHSLYFKGQPPSTATLKLKYRPAGSTGAYTEVMVPKFQVGGTVIPGQFALDYSSISAGTKEYVYEAYDASGKVVNRVGGQMVINGASSSIVSQTALNLDPVYVTQLKWVISGSQSVENQIHQTQEHNAFGDVVAEVDGLGRRTAFAYNALGKLVLKRDPLTDITLANGFITRGSPETRYFYDRLGQTVGVLDANGNLNTLRYADGVIDASGAAVVAQEYHADGGRKTYQYDVFGQLAAVTDEIGQVTRNTYDANGNLLLVDRAGANDDRYEYDQLGNRIAHTNALGNRETWAFDSLGRIVRATSLAGRITTTGYTWDGTILALGSNVAAIGGWIQTVTDANGRTTQDKSDVFGRLRWGKDLGNHATTYSYNAAGWLSQQTSTAGQNLSYAYYDNGYVKTITDTPNNSLTKYEYDDAGNRTFEGYTTATGASREYYQYAEITYDELNRVKTVHDPKYLITYEYDANSNRRRMLSTYSDGVGGNLSTQDYWYTYDSMNRFTLTKGTLADGRAVTADGASTIVKGAEGVAIGYDLAGQRTSATYADHGETYTYRDGQLANTTIDGVLRATRSNLDASGNPSNQVKYVEYNANGAVRTNTTYTYNADNQVTTDRDNLTGYGTTYSYLADGTLNQTVTFGQPTTVTTRYAYEWWDSAREKEVTTQASNASAPGWRPGMSRMTYDVNGNLKLAEDVAGGRSLRYVTNGEGLILQRTESIAGVANVKTHNWYYANSEQIGDVGNDGQSSEDYAQQLAQNKGLTRTESNQRFRPVDTADFDQNYQPINADYPALTASNYVVKSGDTLQSVAAAMWGDASLWYMIADANGLTAASVLTPGTSLTIPNKVANIHNSSETFKVYNPGEKIGDTSPTLPDAPPPPKHGSGGCGGIGMIIVIVVAIVATVLTAGALAPVVGQTMFASGLSALGAGLGGTLGVAGFAAAGAVGSIASQGVAMSMGMQDKFSWSGVALSAAGSVITAGLGGGTKPVGGAGWAGAATRGVIGNAATQGIGVATGLQKKFDWRGVAAAGVGAGVGSAMGAQLGSRIGGDLFGGIAAGGILSGGKFDANTMAGVIGSVIGSAVTGQYGNQEQSRTNEAANLAMQASDPDNLANALRFLARNPTASNDMQTQYDFGKVDTLHLSSPSIYSDAELDAIAAQYATHDGVETRSISTPDIEVRSLGNAYTGVTGEATAMSQWDGFLTFNKGGQFLTGFGSAARNLVPGMLQLGEQAGLAVTDTVDLAINEMGNAITGSNLSYHPNGAVYQSIQSNGILSTSLGAVGSIVKGLVSPLDAIYRGDAHAIGENAFGIALGAAGNFARVRGISSDTAGRQIADLRSVSAEAVNSNFIEQGFKPPYSSRVRPREFTSASDLDFVRVHGTTNQPGVWMVRAGEIDGMSATQIQSHLGLKYAPTEISPVTVSQGAGMRVGRVGPQPQWGAPTPQGIQYELLDITKATFKPSRPLP